MILGAVELALTGGPPPIPTASSATLERYVETASAAAPAVAILSGLAGAMLVVFASTFSGLIVDRSLRRVVWGGGVIMVSMGYAGQAAHQTALQVSGAGSGLLPLTGFLFLLAVVAGGVMAAAAGVAAFRGSMPPRWLGVLGSAVLVIELALTATPDWAGAGFPVFLIWLLAASGWMLLRHRRR